MRRLLCLLCLCSVLNAVTVSSPATVSGDGTVHAIAASGFARVIIISAWPSNSATNCGASAVSGCPWVGDSNVSTSRGQFIIPGGSLTFPNISPEAGKAQGYALNSINYIVQTGDKISITLVQ